MRKRRKVEEKTRHIEIQSSNQSLIVSPLRLDPWLRQQRLKENKAKWEVIIVVYTHFIACQYFKIVSSNLIENSSFLFYQNWCSLARVLTGLHLFITSSSGRKQKTLRMRLLYVSSIHLSPPPFMALFYILSLPLVFLMWESPSLSSLSSNDVTFHWMPKYFELGKAVTMRWRFRTVTTVFVTIR